MPTANEYGWALDASGLGYGDGISRDSLGLPIQDQIKKKQVQAAVNPFQSADTATKTYGGFDEKHLGEADKNGNRPLLSTGFDALHSKMAQPSSMPIADNSDLFKIGQSAQPNLVDMQDMSQPTITKGFIGRTVQGIKDTYRNEFDPSYAARKQAQDKVNEQADKFLKPQRKPMSQQDNLDEYDQPY